MRQIEQAAFDRGMTVDDLMQRAASAISEAALAAAGEGSVLVLAGPGNNGGDGVVAAAKLEAQGVAVSMYSFRRPDARPFSGVVVRSEDDMSRDQLRTRLRRSTVVIDALLGIGQNRKPDSELSEILSSVASEPSARLRKIAVDIPTGVDADSGAVPGAVFQADETVCMGFAKMGVLTYPGAAHAGRVRVVDIGLPPDLGRDILVSTPEPADIASLLPVRDPASNKGSSGRLEVISGSRDFSGAPVLCSMSAY